VSRTGRLPAGILYLAAAAFVFMVWVWGADTPLTALNGDPRSTLAGLIDGTASRPFVQRVLVPVLTRGVVGVIPASARAGFSDALMGSQKFRKESARLGWDTSRLPEYFVALLLSFAALATFPFILRSLFRTLYETDAGLTNLIPLGVLLGLPLFFGVGTHYVYDFPALLLFTAGVLLIVRRDWSLFYPVYAIGCLNKETTVLLALATILVWRRSMPARHRALHAGVQVAIFGAVEYALTIAYAANPGSALEFHLFGNIHNLLLPYTLEWAFFALLIGMLVFYDIERKHEVLRACAWLIVPFGLLMFLFAWMSELRDMYEIYPVFALLIAHTFAFSWGKRAYTLRPLDSR